MEVVTLRQPMVAGNWKMNGTLSSIEQLLGEINAGAVRARGIEITVFAPFVYLAMVQTMLEKSEVNSGAQAVSAYASGAYTGEISAAMLLDFGCRYVLIGHSERRALFGESDDVVSLKLKAAWNCQLAPVICVGETLEQRESGETEQVVGQQIQVLLDAAAGPATQNLLENCVIAYEPVWAIGTGRTASPDQAQQVHAFIRSMIANHDVTIARSVRILYGGSVNSSNAAELFAMPDIDGGLVGGASLESDSFLEIAGAASL